MSELKKRIVVLASTYPYGTGEKTFVEPELIRLKEDFDVVLVCLAPKAIRRHDDNPSQIPQGVKLVHYQLASIPKLLWFSLKYLGSGFNEIKDILRGKRHILGRLMDSMVLFVVAESISDFLQKTELLDSVEDTVYYSYWFNVACLALCRLKDRHEGMRIVARLHGYDLYNERNRHLRQPWQEYMRDRCDRLLFISEHGLDYFKRHFSNESNEGKCLINRLGVEPPEYSFSCRQNDELFRIVSCSSVIPLKRVELILEALKGVSDIKYEWVHFGSGTGLERLVSEAKAFDVNLIAKGQVDNKSIYEYYATNSIDCFITTSSTEGCPVSIMEAEAFGIPIIGTAVGGIPEMIDGNGYLIDANPDSSIVADAIMRLHAQTPEAVQQMRERSHEIFLEKFDSRHNRDEFVALLEQAVQGMED